MIIWAYTLACAAALIIGLICGTLAFSASMPRAMGLTRHDKISEREQLWVYVSMLSACTPILTFWIITMEFWSDTAIVSVWAAAALVVTISALCAPAKWLVAIRPRRLALGLTAFVLCAVAIGARIGQFEALYDGVAPCRELATSDERRECREVFARDWRLPESLTTD